MTRTTATRLRLLACIAALACAPFAVAAPPPDPKPPVGAPPPDDEPPGPPGNLQATAVSGSQINLLWTAATDNRGIRRYHIGRCLDSSCADLGSVTTLSYASTGLTSGTTYTYYVFAEDTSGNMGINPASASATTLDTIAPYPPTGLTVTGTADTQITISWTASTDNVGVVGYAIERCQGASCSNATTAAISFTSTGLSSLTAYNFRVRAYDAASNYSGYAGPVSATTTDTQAPSAPTSLTRNVSGTQVTLTWGGSSDNVTVAGYSVERCQGSGCSSYLSIASSTTTSYVDSGLSQGATYKYQVKARDSVPNYSTPSNSVTATIGDTTAPSAPTSPSATPVSPTQINLSWTSSTDNVGVAAYLIERCPGSSCTNFAQVATSTTTSHQDTGLTSGTYRYQVRARDAASNNSNYSAIFSATTTVSQTPTAPTNLVPTVVSPTQVNLSWTASTDDVAVVGYDVERCTGVGCTNFQPISQETWTHCAYENEWCAFSGTRSVRYGANGAWIQRQLTDGAACSNDVFTDPIYGVEKTCQLSSTQTISTTTFSDSGLTPATTYRYRVRARDAIPNYSAYSAVVDATTGTSTPSDTIPPSAPSSISLNVQTNGITISWGPATDNSGSIANYEIERCNDASCSFTSIANTSGMASSYLDSTATAGTAYLYRVRARDAASNPGSYITSSSATAAFCD